MHSIATALYALHCLAAKRSVPKVALHCWLLRWNISLRGAHQGEGY